MVWSENALQNGLFAHFAIVSIYIYIYIYISIVYKVLSIYRVLPGFREFAVFEKSKRFFYIFLDGCYIEGVRALARAQISSLTSQHVYIGAGTSHRSARSLNCDNFGQEQYFLMR